MHGGGLKKHVVSVLFVDMGKDFHAWAFDDKFADLEHCVTFPSPALVRGDGRMSGKVNLYPKVFRKFTAEKLVRLGQHETIGDNVTIPNPYYGGRFFVVKKRREAEVVVEDLKKYALLHLASSIQVMEENFPGTSWTAFSSLAANYTLVGIDSGRVTDFHQDFAIKGGSEHAYFFEHIFTIRDHLTIAEHERNRRRGLFNHE